MKHVKKILIMIICILFTAANIIFAEKSTITNVEQYKIKDTGKDVEEVAAYLKQRQAELEKLKNMKPPESSLRRLEIIFFSSGAIVYWSTYLFARLFAEYHLEHSSELPDSYWYFIITNSVGMATYITVKDYYHAKEIRGIEGNKYGKTYKNNYKVSLLKAKF